jgi:hypothetical protein
MKSAGRSHLPVNWLSLVYKCVLLLIAINILQVNKILKYMRNCNERLSTCIKNRYQKVTVANDIQDRVIQFDTISTTVLPAPVQTALFARCGVHDVCRAMARRIPIAYPRTLIMAARSPVLRIVGMRQNRCV